MVIEQSWQPVEVMMVLVLVLVLVVGLGKVQSVVFGYYEYH